MTSPLAFLLVSSCQRVSLFNFTPTSRLAAEARGGNGRRGHEGQLAEGEGQEAGGEERVAESEPSGDGSRRSGGLDALEARHGQGEERLERSVVECLHGGREHRREVERE